MSLSKGLAVKIRNCLDDSFKTYGLIKPNADIQQITSQLNTGHLTKEDIVIFLGGTNDISKNESKKGLCSIMAFTQRATNTNLILLEAPHRYDLHSTSCVNAEVNFYKGSYIVSCPLPIM